tara:strand:- start:141 stop:347 length:207 start_codon:yes stop_codon:yes gene_type:complete
MNNAGPPKNLGTPQRFQITVPQDTYDYLALLAKKGKIATKVQDLAAHLVIREVTEMQREKFHEMDFKA